MAKKPIEWTERHQQEALRRIYEIAAEQIGAGRYDGDKFGELTEDAQREDWWRRALREMRLDAARIDREVALVHSLATATPEVRAMVEAARVDHVRVVGKLATGRWVRETSVGVRRGKATNKQWRKVRDMPLRTRADAHGAAKACGGVALRFARIRRAP